MQFIRKCSLLRQQEIETVNNRILAAVLLVVGLILLFFAYQSSQSLGDQVTEAVTGRFTDSTTWFLILGAASAVAGVGLLVFGKSAGR
jgi:drug/metabolite transporter (DMT)-like permease